MTRRLPAAGAIGVVLVALAGCTPLAPSAADSTARAESGVVVAVVDGDTIDVRLDAGGGKVRVRLIGIDTPEISRTTGTPDECYAEEARSFLDDLLYRRPVQLRTDPTQADVDAYGRLLRHVYQDGQNAALAALTAGAGVEYTYDRLYAGHADYQAAETTARGTYAGLWGTCPMGLGYRAQQK